MGTLTNFRAEDFESAASKEKKPRRRRAPQKRAEAPQADPNAVPDGTTDEVLDWVGEDRDRAARALEKENAGDRPRVTLTGPLETLLSGEKDEKDGDEKADEGEKAEEKPAKKAPAKKAPAKKAAESDK